MDLQTIDIACPNCSQPCSVYPPTDATLGRFDTLRGEKEIACPTCGWEFVINSEGVVADDGEAEPEAELVVDAEGNVGEPEADDDPFPSWHGSASLNAEARGRHSWRDYAADPFEPDENEEDGESVHRVSAVICPNCRQVFRDGWLGPIHCPGCLWQFRVDTDRSEDDYEEGEDDFYDFANPQSPEARALRPLVVSPSGQDDFTSIREALARAEPGRRIRVRPGLYEEEIAVNTPVEIVGAGPREQVIIVGRRGPCLTMQCSTAVVRGLTLRGLDRGKDRKAAAVELDFGRIEDCAITSASPTCVRMRGGSLCHCRIHDGESAGVVASAGSIEDCEVLCNGGPGVCVDKEGSALIVRCHVHEGYAEGIVIAVGGQATLVECDVWANAKAGVVVQGERTLLWKCRIHDGAAEGIRIPTEGVAFVEHCAIFANARAGLRVAGGSVYVWRSRFHDGRNIGIALGGGGVIDLRHCTVYRNARAGVTRDAHTWPFVRRCRIRANHRADR
jgi:hypothetical protein